MSNIEDLRWLAEQGCHFALPAGRTKNKFEFDWPNKPHTLDEAIAHSIHGNVGILTGKHSGNIIAIDRDVNFPETCAMLGQFAHTAKIVRDNAPERGKFLYRIKGEIPPTTSWKPPGGKHPEAELLADNGQRHALCPPSVIEDGCYILLDKELGIQELTPVELDYIWRLITGGSIYKETRVKEEQQVAHSNKDDYVYQVKEAWGTLAIFAHFGLTVGGTELDRGETRILGNGGLMVMEDDDRWYCHSETIGGDKIDAWAYCKWNHILDRDNKQMFWDTINDMASAAGITRPSTNGAKPAPQTPKKTLSAKEYCDTINEGDPLQQAWSVLRGKETVHINGFVGVKNGTRIYTIKETEGEVLETELLVELSNKKKVFDPKNVSWSDYADAMTQLGYTMRMNELDDCVEINDERLSDGIESQILMKMHDIGLKKAEWVKRSYVATAHQNRYHPVRDFLNSLTWDGTDWLAEMERYVWDKHGKIIYPDGRAIPVFGAWLKRWGVGAVAKIMRDGQINAQNPMLVLIGGQNVGKSTLARHLCPMKDDFFIESQISPDNKDHDRYLATKMVWEVAELGATTRKADREWLKAFLTKQDVTFRVPYAHHPVTKPALASFIGTINPEIGFLNDPTGNRRYLPVEIARIDFDYITKVPSQKLWSQFVALYKSGEQIKLTPEELSMADAIRSGHEVEDNLAGFIIKYYTINLDRSDPDKEKFIEWSETTTDIVEQLTLNGVKDVNVSSVGSALRSLKMGRARQRVSGVQETRWYGLKRNDYGDKYRR